MHLGFVIRKTLENIYCRKLNFLLTSAVLVVTMYLTFTALGLFFRSSYYIYETKHVFSSQEILSLNLLYDVQDNDYYTNVVNYIELLKETYGDDFTYFMYYSATLSKNNQTEESCELLYLDKNAFDLGHLSLTNELSANEISANGYLRCYVCESKKADYPVGTTFKDVHTENQMIVAGYFPAGSTWMPDSLFHSTNAVVTLDDYIVSEMDEGYFQIDNLFYGNIFNSCYIKHVSEEQSEQVLSELKELADTVGVLCYVHTLNQLVETEKEDNKDLINSVGILTLFVILVSLSSACTACLSDVFSRRSDTAIMSITGVSPTDLYMMLLVENLLKWLIAFCLASAIYLNGQDADGSHVFTTMLLPVCALGGLVCMAAITTISQISMKQKHLLDWIGDSKL